MSSAAVASFLPIADLPPHIVALDIECTGKDPLKDKIIEIGLVRIYPDGRQEAWQSFVNPRVAIPTEITVLTGITDADVSGAPTIQDLIPQLQLFLSDGIGVVGHNIAFDLAFLSQAGVRTAGLISIDTFRLAQLFFPAARSMNLQILCEDAGIDVGTTHRALDDTRLSLLLYRELIIRARALNTYGQIVLEFLAAAEPVASIFSQFFGHVFGDTIPVRTRSVLLPALREAILEVVRASAPKFPRLTPKTECTLSATELLALGAEALGTPLEVRAEQGRMIGLVSDTFAQESLTVIEAPTGVGKTLAYLAPAVVYALTQGKTVFVSTHTKTLQDQLLGKDLPMVAQMLAAIDPAFTLQFIKLKGRANLISLGRFLAALGREDGFLAEEIGFFGKILFWLTATTSGDLDELSLYNEEFGLLEHVRASHPYTLHQDNPYRKDEFLARSRDAAKQAHIVVINHALLATEVSAVAAARILPDIKHLVVDEAHALVRAVTESCRQEASFASCMEALASLDHVLKRLKAGEWWHSHDFSFDEFESTKASIELNLGAVFDFLLRYANAQAGSGGMYEDRDAENLIESDIRQADGYEAVVRMIGMADGYVREVVRRFYAAPEAMLGIIENTLQTLERNIKVLDSTLIHPKDDEIRTITLERKTFSAKVATTLLSVGPYLRERLFSTLTAGVLTSATLAVDGSFDYATKVLGLQDFASHALASDFDYATQWLLLCPEDSPEPRSPQGKAAFHHFLIESIRAVGGRTLVLFTSFSALREAHAAISPTLHEFGITVLGQGVSGGRAKVLETFRRHASATALLGTDSFWEGVDIPGDDLSLLIIQKLPFSVPTDPVFQARSATYERPFDQYAVPEMLLKLRQGFGRLIRTRSDRGVIVLLDPRVHSTRWGKRVWGAAPAGIKMRSDSMETFLQLLRQKQNKS